MNILVSVISGFASGIFCRSLFLFSSTIIFFLIVLAFVALASFASYGRTVSAYVALFFLCIALGAARTAIADSSPPPLFLNQLHRRVSYEGIVIRDPDVREKSQRTVLRVEQGGVPTRMLAVAKLTPAVHVGDRVSVSGTLELPKPFDTEGGRIFAYDKYLAKDGIRFMLNFAYLHTIEPAPWYSLPAALARAKHVFINALEQVLPRRNAALASGLVIGGKPSLGADLQNAFVRSGLVQIVVLSGYNIMIVAEWVMAGLSLVTYSRRAQALAGAMALALFVGIAGFSATALRATLMALIALYARATSRTYDAGRALLVAVLMMLVWNPLYLVFDPGFGLSVAATAGLIWLSPLIAQKLKRVSIAAAREALSTTIAAQLAVLPLLIYQTGMLSLVALPTNIMAMPAVPLAMACAALAGAGSIIFHAWLPELATLIALPAKAATTFLIWLAQTATALPMSAVLIPAFPFAFVVLAYAALALIAFSKRRSMTLQLRLEKKASM